MKGYTTAVYFFHILATDCKKGVPPRGLTYLEEVCNAVSIPVYGIGGITIENAKEVINHGVEGICMMSSLMNGQLSGISNNW